MARVNILTSDKGWILEKLASELASRIPYVYYNDFEDSKSDIQYYITYSRRKKKISPIEVAYFAHLEQDIKTKENFFYVAKNVDYCVCHSHKYENELLKKDINHVITISPGVDLEKYQLKLRIGVVGRTYHTGRKGESLISSLMDLQEIEWHFTGDGWPASSHYVSEEYLPNFYRDMDYILVPSLYEGGPMCVVEALACGREVIASSVGWVDEFPHIPFENGNAEDLRRVLLELIEKRKKLRETVLHITWDSWAEGHDRLFRKLLTDFGRPLPEFFDFKSQSNNNLSSKTLKPILLLHGNENKAKGGPSLRVPRTTLELKAYGIAAEYSWISNIDFNNYDLAHIFNVWNPNTALDTLSCAKNANIPIVFSPIYLDLSERTYWNDELLTLFKEEKNPVDLDKILYEKASILAIKRNSNLIFPEPLAGYYSKLKRMMNLSDHIIFLSKKEKFFLEKFNISFNESTFIPNPIDVNYFYNINKDYFSQKYNIKDYVLCVGRIEPRKNQLMLVHALKNTNIPLVLIGHTQNDESEYNKLVHANAGKNVLFIDRLPPNSDILKSAFLGAKVFVLPSWAEGAPLAALEAAASGCSLVLSNRSSEQEYFGDLAMYCDPANPISLREIIIKVWNQKKAQDSKDILQKYTQENYSWEKYINKTINVYKQVIQNSKDKKNYIINGLTKTLEQNTKKLHIVFDITTSFNHKGRWTGISRTEQKLIHALFEQSGVTFNFIIWLNSEKRFISIPNSIIECGNIQDYTEVMAKSFLNIDTSQFYGAMFLVVGSAWMQNEKYTSGVVAFTRQNHMFLVPVIHDIIPIIYPFWFNENYASIFIKNLRILMHCSFRVIVNSKTTKRDLETFLFENGIYFLSIDIIHLGCEIENYKNTLILENKEDNCFSLFKENFILSVGAIHLRKNYDLLYEIWIKLVVKLKNKTPHLVIVGGVAWNGKNTARALKEDKRIKNYIHILEDISDEELIWLYQHCLFTVYPSHYEGWGLPVAESLNYKKICLASNISSIPEISPQCTDLLDPSDIEAWYSRIIMYINSPVARQNRENEIIKYYKSFSWNTTAIELIKILKSPVFCSSKLKEYDIGQLLKMNDPITMSRYQNGNWYIPESWGCWTSGKNAGFCLIPTTRPLGKIFIAFEIRSIVYKNLDLYQKLQIYINKILVGTWDLRQIEKNICLALLPFEHKNLSLSELEINFAVSPIRSINKKNDIREVGVGVISFVLIDNTGWTNLNTYFLKSLCLNSMIQINRPYELTQDDYFPFSSEILQQNHIWGIHTKGNKISIQCMPLTIPSENFIIELAIRPNVLFNSSQKITILINNEVKHNIVYKKSYIDIVKIPIKLSIFPFYIDIIGSNPKINSNKDINLIENDFCVGLHGLMIYDEAFNHVTTSCLLHLGEWVHFTKNAFLNKNILKNTGWYTSEETGTWSKGFINTLYIKVSEEITNATSLLIVARTIAWKEDVTETLCVYINDTLCGTVTLSEKWNIYNISLDKSCLIKNTINKIIFNISGCNSPYNLGMGKDQRELGFILQKICFISEKNISSPLEKTINKELPIYKNFIPSEFSEQLYLQANPDVAEAVASGNFNSGYHHWLMYGKKEKRNF